MGIISSKQELASRAQKVFREVFEDPDLLISAETTAADIPKWDSLAHINLIIAIEQEFGVLFRSEEITSMSRVGDLFTLLEQKKR